LGEAGEVLCWRDLKLDLQRIPNCIGGARRGRKGDDRGRELFS